MALIRYPALWPILLLTLFGVLDLGQKGVEAWDTNFDAPFTYNCPSGQVLYNLYSEHSNYREDRRWTFGCRPVHSGVSAHNCSWTGYVNAWDSPLNFQCPADYVITGIGSYHSNYREDRRFRFKCCLHTDLITSSCGLTPYVNDWDDILDYTVSPGKALVGAYSYHRNYKEDRRWKFRYCEYSAN